MSTVSLGGISAVPDTINTGDDDNLNEYNPSKLARQLPRQTLTLKKTIKLSPTFFLTSNLLKETGMKLCVRSSN